MYVYALHYGSIKYMPGQLSDLIFIFMIIGTGGCLFVCLFALSDCQ